MIQYKRHIPIKAKDGTTLRSDNTNVNRPQIFERIQATPGYGTEWTYVDTSKLPNVNQESNVAAGAVRLARPLLQPIVQSIATASPVIGSFLGARAFQTPSNWTLVPNTQSVYRVPITNGMIDYAEKPLTKAEAQKEQEIEAAMDRAYSDSTSPNDEDQSKKDDQKNGEQKDNNQKPGDKKPNWARRAWDNLRRPVSKIPHSAWSAYKWSWYIPAGLDVVGNTVGLFTQGRNYAPDLRFLSGRSLVERKIGSLIGNGLEALGSTYSKNPSNQSSNQSSNTSNNQETQTSTTSTTEVPQSRSAQSIADSLETVAIQKTKELFDSIQK